MTLERTPFVSAFCAVALTILVSFFYFPVGLNGLLPESVNTKQVLGAFGVVLFVLHCVRDKEIVLPRYILVSFLYALIFSIWCFFSCTYNGTEDYAYAKYIMSFIVWLSGGYAVCDMIRFCYGRVDLPLITKFLAAVGVMQCILVLFVDNAEWMATFIDNTIIQDTTAKEVDRLYGMGCSLDSGGVRLSTILVLIAHQLATNKQVTDKKLSIATYVVAMVIIGFVGNMIARTTTLGLGLGLCYIAMTIWLAKNATLTGRQVRFRTVFLSLITAGVVTGVILYNTDPAMRQQIRFAFEAFFNLFEKGELSTSSSDILLKRMIVWPWTDAGWVVGYGLFEWSNWTWFQTDIGYCRFILYCGLVGMFLFSLYFVYNAFAMARKFNDSWLLAMFLLMMSFIIWMKVSTDIFQLYALLFCVSATPGPDPDDEPQ